MSIVEVRFRIYLTDIVRNISNLEKEDLDKINTSIKINSIIKNVKLGKGVYDNITNGKSFINQPLLGACSKYLKRKLGFSIYIMLKEITENIDNSDTIIRLTINEIFNILNYGKTSCIIMSRNNFKNSGVVSTGQIYVAKKTVENPTDNDVGLIDISVNVNQIKILKLVGTIPTTNITVEQTADVDINIEFSGTRLALNDPNLTISKLFTSETGIKTFNQNTVTLECPNWKFVGRSYNETGVYRVDYRDPADGKTYTIARIDLPVTITYPPMRVVQTTDTIDAKIWDKNVFPLKLMAGDHDFTNAIYSTELITANKYVAINGLNWNVYFAESTATSTIVGIRMRWSVGETTNQSNSTDFKFNLAAWDGITFAVTELVPEGTLTLASGQAGEISVKLVYKGNDATQTAILDLANSDIPRTFTLGSPHYDNTRGLVIPYTPEDSTKHLVTLLTSNLVGKG
jgi:hypothetical protein